MERYEFKVEGPKGKCVKIVVFENGYIICRQLIISPGGGGYSLIWAMWGRAAGQGMVFGLAVLNRVYNLTCLCPKQGMVLRAERL